MQIYMPYISALIIINSFNLLHLHPEAHTTDIKSRCNHAVYHNHFQFLAVEVKALCILVRVCVCIFSTVI